MNAVEFEEELPEKWVNTKLGNLLESVKKINPKDMPDKLFYYCDINSIDNLQFKITAPKQFLGKHAPSRARQVIKHGDILFSTVRTYLKNIAIVPSDLDGQLASTGFCILRPKQNVDNTFIFNYVQYDDFLSSLNSKQRGTSYPAVRNDDVLDNMILLPPLNEQRRIVSKIESIFAQIDAAKERLERLASQTRPASGSLDMLRNSVLKQAFEGKLVPQDPDDEPAEILLKMTHKKFKKELIIENKNLPDGWIKIRLGDHLELKYGKGISKKDRKPGIIPIYGSSGITGYHNFALVKDYSIVVGRKGSAGNVQFVDRPCWPIDTTYFINKTTIYILKFLYYLLVYSCLQNLDSSTAIPSLRRDDAYDLKIPLPPYNEQKRIVAKIESIFAEIDAIEQYAKSTLQLLDQLKNSTLKQAFEGKLVPQDPNDKPAELILQKIKQENSLMYNSPDAST